MNLQALLQRAYSVLGDDFANPRFFPRARLVDLMNRGVQEFRSEVNDEWYERDIALVSGTAIYDFPVGHVRTQRVAYADKTLVPRGVVGALTGQDELWQDHTAQEPIYWTSDALPHNQFRVVPTPSVTSTEFWSFALAASGGSTIEDGTVVETTSPDETFTFILDPADPAHLSIEDGLVLGVDGFAIDSEDGVLVEVDAEGADVLTVWGTLRAGEMSGDGDDVPIKAAYSLAPLWYCLWRTFEEEAEHHNSTLAGFYKSKWKALVDGGKAVAENPFPREVHVIRGGAPWRSLNARFSDSITGVGNVTW